MLVDIVLAALAFYFSIPLIAGYFAKCYGRSFWLWFVLGTFLPVIAHFILIGLVYYDESKAGPTTLSRGEEAEAKELVRELLASLPEIKPAKKTDPYPQSQRSGDHHA
jgi:hypothetical protein